MAEQQLVKGYLGTLRNGQIDRRLQFQYNPKTVDIEREAEYADNKAALADLPNSSDNALPAAQWLRNKAEEFTVETVWHKDGADEHVADELQTLDDFMRPDGATGRPLDIVLSMGTRADRVRILRKQVRVELFTKTLQPRRAIVTMRLKAMRSRTR